MDLGATVCTRTRPDCERCPVASDCVARREGRIDELPAVRKRRPLPLKHATWLVLLHKGSVLLQRRPGTGIWGGLWVFPDGPEKNAGAFCEKSLSCAVAKTQRMPVIEHGFTHFRLNIQPIRCSVRKILAHTEAPGRIWLDLEDAVRAAIPAPVRKLLLELA
jgi:A/G-specific adenine glycosylase